MKNPCNNAVYFGGSGKELSLSGAAVGMLFKAVTEKGRPFKFKARGWSMAPFIRDNDILTLSPSSVDIPQKGDVVGVIDPVTETLVVHRIVGTANGRFWIKGDSAKTKESRSFKLESICGRVTRVERDGKQVRMGLGSEKKTIAMLSQVPLAMWFVAKAMGLGRKIGRAGD